tara:strand:+ start:250 stop:642 length:393 start_codon:yes stop_codon:yes gene_type:complete
MAEEVQQADQLSYLMSDFNTRLRDFGERNRLIRERVLLLGKNLISTKTELGSDIGKLKKENYELKKELEKIKRITNNILTESEKFVKRDETIAIERMLKDFQPLEFLRKKDVEELIKNNQEKSSKKELNT